MKRIRVVFGKWGGRPHWEYDALHLDLDVVRGWSGRVWVDDEDEFARNRVRFGYPDEVVELAVDTCEGVRRAVLPSEAPFDGPTAQRWLQCLDEAMMLR